MATAIASFFRHFRGFSATGLLQSPAVLAYNLRMNQPAVLVEHDVCNATLIARHDLTAQRSIIRCRPDSGRVPSFVPGQFIKLGLPRSEEELEALSRMGRAQAPLRLVRRAYSMTSTPHQTDFMEFLIIRVEQGKLTPQLWNLDVGSRIWMDDHASGLFTLESILLGQDVVMVSTGTGIAPFISMLRTMVDEPPWRHAVVINGARYIADLSYRDELEAMARTHANIQYIPIVSREGVDVGGGEGAPVGINVSRGPFLHGRVQRVLESDIYKSLTGRALAPHHCHVMLCGNPAMIESAQTDLEHRGFCTQTPIKPGNIHFERYW